MKGIEFYTFEDQLWYMTSDGNSEKFTENSREILKNMIERIKELYPDAFSSLTEAYSNSRMNVPYFQYLMVNRFCKCNFGNIDNQKDIDFNGDLHFERVSCPLRGECKYENRICNPVFNSKLSDAELRVMKLLYNGVQIEQIASKLYLSPHTVKNHIKSCYLKLRIHEKSEFVTYAHKNNLFKN